MGKCRRLVANPYSSQWPLDASTQTFEIGVATAEPVSPSVPVKATAALNEAQAEQERLVKKLNETKPDRVRPGSRR